MADAAVPVPPDMAAPPTAERRAIAEQAATAGASSDLASLIALSPLGPSDRGARQAMSVAIVADPTMERRDRRTVLREVLAYMAQAFDHIEADEEVL